MNGVIKGFSRGLSEIGEGGQVTIYIPQILVMATIQDPVAS